MNKITTALTTLSLGLTLVLAPACTKKGADGAAGTGASGEIRFRLPTDPPTLDWTLATDNVSKEVISPMQVGLVAFDRESKIVPDLAEKWDITDGGKTYTFKIRPNAKWSDGQPVTAQQFVDGWERLLLPKTASEYAYFLFDVAGAEEFQSGKSTDFTKVGIKAPDATTLVVTLKAPTAYWINVPAFWVTFPTRKDIVEKFGDKWTNPGNIVSNGPYMLKSVERDSRIVLEKNPHYYNPEAQKSMVDRLVFRIVKDDTTAVALFNSGDLDIVRDLPPLQVQVLASRPEFKASPYLRGYYYGFDTKEGPTKNVKIRQAIAHAIDRTELEKVLGPSVKATSYWNQPGLVGHDANIGLKFDVAKAKALFAEAKGETMTGYELWFDQKEKNKLVAENIQAQLSRNLGIEVKLSSQEWKVYLKSLRSDAPPMWRLGWGADYPDANNFLDLFTCKSGNNMTGFCNAKYDSLISAAARELDEGKRAQSYRTAERILLEEDVAIVPLFSETNMHLVSKRVEGIAINSMGDFDYNAMRLNAR